MERYRIQPQTRKVSFPRICYTNIIDLQSSMNCCMKGFTSFYIFSITVIRYLSHIQWHLSQLSVAIHAFIHSFSLLLEGFWSPYNLKHCRSLIGSPRCQSRPPFGNLITRWTKLLRKVNTWTHINMTETMLQITVLVCKCI